MKNLLKIAVLLGFLGMAAWLFTKVDWQEVKDIVGSQKIYLQRDDTASFLTNWSEEELLLKINEAREASAVAKLSRSSKLDQAARARLAVVLEEDDVDGSRTGISREKALTNSGYEASLIGDLVLVGFFKTNDPIGYWESVKAAKETIFHRDFKDIGIAVKNSESRVDVYAMLATPKKIVRMVTPKTSWGGPELWNVINKRRVEMGVNPLKQMDILCTVASIRLNQLLELGKLDGHAGFVSVLERSDLKDRTEKYNISEFLIQGYNTPEEAVSAWENTMGHRVLLSGGEYVWGCVYAQNTFGVAIAAY